MKKGLGFGAWGLVVVLCVSVIGCAALGTAARDAEAKWRVTMLPADKQAADTELAVDKAQIDKLNANIASANTLIAADARMDNKYTKKVIAGWKTTIEYLQDRVTRIDAVKPTLPDKPTPTTNPTPTVEPAK